MNPSKFAKYKRHTVCYLPLSFPSFSIHSLLPSLLPLSLSPPLRVSASFTYLLHLLPLSFSSPHCQRTSDKLVLSPVREPVMLQRAGHDREKNSDMVKALVRANPSYASSAISSLLGGSKDDTCELVCLSSEVPFPLVCPPSLWPPLSPSLWPPLSLFTLHLSLLFSP